MLLVQKMLLERQTVKTLISLFIGAVCSGSTLIAQAYLPENLENNGKIPSQPEQPSSL